MSNKIKTVISQSMYFPWVGLLEQIAIADNYVYYDDVNFSRGFFNRVQIKTIKGPKWLTVPVKKWHRGDNINLIQINNDTDWQRSQLDLLFDAYRDAPYKSDMLKIVEKVFSEVDECLYSLSRNSLMILADYFNLSSKTDFICSKTLIKDGRSTDRLVRICKKLGSQYYITGHGAKKYLDHAMFEKENILVFYMNYKKRKYPQQHGNFTPFVSALDLIANCGPDGGSFLDPQIVYWKNSPEAF